MREEVFDIRMEKVDDNTSDSKYAIIGYFAEKQKRHNDLIAYEAAHGVPVKTTEPSNNGSVQTLKRKHYTLSNILAESTAEQWLLAFIAFLLFINLLCKS